VCTVLPFMCFHLHSNDKKKVATNIVCYTRSNPLIHQLPSLYPNARSTYSTKQKLEKSKELIEALIYDQVLQKLHALCTLIINRLKFYFFVNFRVFLHKHLLNYNYKISRTHLNKEYLFWLVLNE